MAKRKGVVRRTVSLPPELDRRMEKQQFVNWSEVARAAFEAKLTELEPKKELSPMTEGIERLRKLQAEEAGEFAAQGRSDGARWAAEDAHPSQLRRLKSWVEGIGNNLSAVLEATDTPVRYVLEAINGEEPNRLDIEEFTEQTAGEDGEATWNTQGYVTGFIAGALEIWSQV